MSSPIDLLFEHFSISTILSLITLYQIENLSITKIGVLPLFLIFFILLLSIHSLEYDIYNCIKNKNINSKLLPNIGSAVAVGLATLYFYRNGDMETYKILIIDLLWCLIVSTIWLFLKEKYKMTKPQKKKNRRRNG